MYLVISGPTLKWLLEIRETNSGKQEERVIFIAWAERYKKSEWLRNDFFVWKPHYIDEGEKILKTYETFEDFIEENFVDML